MTAPTVTAGAATLPRSLFTQAAALIAAVEEWGAAACLVGVAVLVNFQFIDRFSGEPYVWTEEVSRILMIWMACLGMAAVTRRGVHIGVDAVQTRLKGTVRSVYFRLMEGITCVVFGFVCGQAILLLRGSRGVELASTEWPIAVIIWAMVVGAGLSAVHALMRCLAGPPAAPSAILIQDA
ncbi:TRAP transporter small permease [uncultured Alsobacter sp.]|uniref:TRAP transporter small permease n=1 Tax=uncultured Alsobacter sp. TaxID=1748258 RepID=UPI0025D3C37F|nr:TRAP transporter small permease subunit [uncultured Alsobacter sp.]